VVFGVDIRILAYVLYPTMFLVRGFVLIGVQKKLEERTRRRGD